MIIRTRSNRDVWRAAVAAKMDHLSEPISWFPFPALIALGLGTVFFGHLLFNFNPRITSSAEVLSFDGDVDREGGIFLSVVASEDGVIVDTGDRRRFVIVGGSRNSEDLAQLITYMKTRTATAVSDVILSSRIDPIATTVTIAADQHLAYFHIKPILYALSQAGISRYAFETKMTLKDQNSEGREHF